MATIETTVNRTSSQSKHSTGLILVQKASIRELLMTKGNLCYLFCVKKVKCSLIVH